MSSSDAEEYCRRLDENAEKIAEHVRNLQSALDLMNSRMCASDSVAYHSGLIEVIRSTRDVEAIRNMAAQIRETISRASSMVITPGDAAMKKLFVWLFIAAVSLAILGLYPMPLYAAFALGFAGFGWIGRSITKGMK